MFNKVESDPSTRCSQLSEKENLEEEWSFFEGGGGVSNYCTVTFKVHSK